MTLNRGEDAKDNVNHAVHVVSIRKYAIGMDIISNTLKIVTLNLISF